MSMVSLSHGGWDGQAEDLARVCCVCAELRHAAATDRLWGPLLDPDWSACSPAPTSPRSAPSLKAIYARRVALMRRRRAESRCASRRARWTGGMRHSSPLLVQPPLPGFVPGVVGGDYDRLPFLPGGGGGGVPSPLSLLGGRSGPGGGLLGPGAPPHGQPRGMGHWRLR